AVGGDLLEVTVQIEALGVVVFDDGTKVCGLLGQGDHQVWALDAAWKPGEVFDLGGGHECTAMAHGTGDDSGGEACPAGIDGRSVSGWAGPYDEQLVGGISQLSGGGHLRLHPVQLDALGRCRDEQLGYELLDAGFNVVANGPDGLNALAGRVLELPVFVAFAREDRTGIAAAHGDDDIRGFDRFGSQDVRGGRGNVNAFFSHGFDRDRVELVGGFGPGRADLDAALAKLPDVAGGHLGTPSGGDGDQELGRLAVIIGASRGGGCHQFSFRLW